MKISYFTPALILLFFGCSRHLPQQKDYGDLVDSTNILYSKYEVTNKDYRLFLEDIKLASPALLSPCEYDSTLWSSKVEYSYNKPIREHYHHHEFYDFYPVVNIGLQGAVEYYKWLTKQQNNQWPRKYKEVIVRLPTQNDMLALIKTVNIKYDSNDKWDYADFHFNLYFKDDFRGDFKIDGYLFTAPVYDCIQNAQGFCSIIGNAGEFIESEKNLGGNWYTLPLDVTSQSNLDAPDPRIRFRCVMEVVRR